MCCKTESGAWYGKYWTTQHWSSAMSMVPALRGYTRLSALGQLLLLSAHYKYEGSPFG